MELKDFIKQVIQEVTDAVTESQREITNGSIVAPYTLAKGENTIVYNDKRLLVSDIHFDVCVSTEEHSELNGGIKVIAAGTSCKESTTHRISFSVKVAYAGAETPTLKKSRPKRSGQAAQ